MSSHKFETLRAAIFAVADEKHIWSRAVNEFRFICEVDLTGFELDGVWHAHKPRCLCTTLITRNFVLRHHGGQLVTVGSTCVRNFMRDNVGLVQAVEHAIFMHDRRPCEVCAKPTKHPRACARCTAELARRDAVAAQRAAGEKKWEGLIRVLDVDRLNPAERKFVCESVRGCIMSDRKLSDKQRKWLMQLCKRQRVG